MLLPRGAQQRQRGQGQAQVAQMQAGERAVVADHAQQQPRQRSWRMVQAGLQQLIGERTHADGQQRHPQRRKRLLQRLASRAHRTDGFCMAMHGIILSRRIGRTRHAAYALFDDHKLVNCMGQATVLVAANSQLCE